MNQPLSISTKHRQDVCDVCSRTLLRGEHSEVFVNGGRRYNVCELCKPRALHEGWVREGMIPDVQGSPDRAPRRRALFGRRRARVDRGLELRSPVVPRSLDDELSMSGWNAAPPAPDDSVSQPGSWPAPPPVGSTGRSAGPRGSMREPRHVHAIPTSGDHKVAVAAEVFNASSHRRTIAGVARSLGAPTVNITPDRSHPSIVWIVVSWELCWYRYEVDLSDAEGHARLDGQGYELNELSDEEVLGNAGSDESGALILL